jgi:hypothetical protein
MAFQQFPQKGGIPSGNTAGRPSNPVIGDTYYNGQLEILEIYNGTQWVANSAPPATPSISSVTDVGTVAYASGGSLSVVFSPGSGGGTPSQYNAYTTSGGFTASSSTTTVTLTGLTPATSFTVYGNAQNNFGTTVNTANAAEVTATTRPQTPTIGTATASSIASEVTVTWTNGATGGKNISAITITPYLNGTTAQTSRTAATTSSTSYTFTSGQLTAGSAYTFKVKATNANGDSPESSASNSVTVASVITVDYLVVAGGGAGNYSPGNGGTGGGGAGGLRSTVTATGGGGSLETALSIVKGTNYTVTVGAGGASTQSSSLFPGENSVFATVTSTGGGGGGPGQLVQAGAGGSGGGAGENSSGYYGIRTASPVQGYDGGGTIYTGSDGHGGGGAGAVGANGVGSSAGGSGGNGAAVSITGTSVTYAGGGGASSYSGTGGDGGTGGGGNGTGPSNRTSGTAGGANTGGGGGSIGGSRGYGGSSAGGSGVVILRWLTSDATISVGAGLTADSTGTDGSYSYKRFTAGSGNVSFS